MNAPTRIPARVRTYAIERQIPLRLTVLPDGSDWYYSAGNDMTRTSQPRACHALALCRRYLAAGGAVWA